MQSHTQEMAALAEAARNGQTRFNLYAGIHKAMRAMLADTLHRIGRTDPDNPEEVADTAQAVAQMLAFCHSHVQHENTFVHTALESRCAGVTQTVAHDHTGHLHHIAELGRLAASLAEASTQERAASLQSLYLLFALFVADNLAHMHVEETALNNALWASHTDAEILAIHDALVATIPFEETLWTMRWMLPHLHAGERLAVLQGMKAGGAPAEAIQAVLEAARPHLNECEWAQLLRGLGQAPVPGLVAV